MSINGRACCAVYAADVKDGTMSSKPVKHKGYVVDMTSNYDMRSVPPSYYRATPSHVGGRSGMYGSQTLDNGRPLVGYGQSDVGGPRYNTHSGLGGGEGTAPRQGQEPTRHRSATEPRNRRGSF